MQSTPRALNNGGLHLAGIMRLSGCDNLLDASKK